MQKNLSDYLQAADLTMEDLRDHARENAVAAARYELAMTEIARREGIDITEADLDAKYQELSRQYDPDWQAAANRQKSYNDVHTWRCTLIDERHKVAGP